MNTKLTWDLLKPFVEDVSYDTNEMDFYVRDLDYVLYCSQCESNFVEPIKPVDNQVRNNRLYFIVKYDDVRED